MNVTMSLRRFAEKNGWHGFAEISLPGVELIKGSITNSRTGGVYFNCSNSSSKEQDDGKKRYYANVKLAPQVQTACDQVLNLAYTRCNEVTFTIDDNGRVTIDKDSIKVGAVQPTLIENSDILMGMAQNEVPQPRTQEATKEQVAGESNLDEAFN